MKRINSLFFKLFIMIVVILLIAVSLFAESQKLSADGKKNLRSANMYLGQKIYDKALPLYEEVLIENPHHIVSLENIAEIYYDIIQDYFEANSFYSNAITEINSIFAEYQEILKTDENAAKKFYKKHIKKEKLEDKLEQITKFKASCWIILFKKAQNKFSIVNDFNSLNPDTFDMTDINSVKTLNSLLIKINADTINTTDLANNTISVDEIGVHFDNLLDESLIEFLALSEIAPDSTKTIKMLAYAYNEKGDTEKTLEYMIKNTELEPEDDMVRTQIANTYFNMEDFEKAIDWYKKASEINPLNFDNFYNLAITYSRLDNPEQAYESYKKALEIEPDNIDAILSAYGYAARLNLIDEAISYLKRAHEFEPERTDILSDLCFYLSNSQRFEDLLIYAAKWYELDKESQDAQLLLNLAKQKIK